uniref:Acyl carrier protein n=1 Tax=Trichuris muris TaxID=70415 RepID=A0A5S6QGG4_TRIMR
MSRIQQTLRSVQRLHGVVRGTKSAGLLWSPVNSAVSGRIGAVSLQQKRWYKIAKPPEMPKEERKWTKEMVNERIIEIISGFHRLSGEKSVTPSTHLVNDLGLDSLDHVEVVSAIEEEFGLEIPDSDSEKLLTVHEIGQYVCQKANVTE